jgi:putative tryptophan/tyrosine transport system substrate-binding protein
MLSRRDALVAAGTLIAATSARIVTAQPASSSKARRVGVIVAGSAVTTSGYVGALKQGMRELGWNEGNIVFHEKYAEGRVQSLPALAQALVSEQVDVVVCSYPPAVRAMLSASNSTPIVMGNVSDALRNGFIASLSHPGGTVTGITSQLEDTIPKIIEFVRQLVPSAKRLGALFNPTNPSTESFAAAARAATDALQLEFVREDAGSIPEVEPAIVSLVESGRADSGIIVADAMFLSEREKIARIVSKLRLPTGYLLKDHVKAGGLVSYGSSINANFRRAAYFVDRILKGAKPADLPAERPTHFELIVNRHAAEQIGITIPDLILMQADEVIE